jgi:hypothetical protein
MNRRSFFGLIAGALAAASAPQAVAFVPPPKAIPTRAYDVVEYGLGYAFRGDCETDHIARMIAAAARRAERKLVQRVLS